MPFAARRWDSGHRLGPRLVLASEALSGTFTSLSSEFDLERALDSTGSVLNDAQMMVYVIPTLGGRLNSDVRAVLPDHDEELQGRDFSWGDELALNEAASSGARAETALRVAILLSEDGEEDLSPRALAALLGALRQSGMSDMTGRILAESLMP